MSFTSQRALTLVSTQSHKLGVQISSSMKICNENLMEDEHDLLLVCLTFNVIHEKYDDLTSMINQSVILVKSPPRRVHINVCASFSHEEFYYRVTPFLGRIHIQDEMFIWLHGSNLASS